MWRNFFSKKPVPLSGAPAVRRLKTYSAQSGYVYQYFYEGQRPFPSGGESGLEFVFTVSADRKSWHAVSVLVAEEALRAWREAGPGGPARNRGSALPFNVGMMARGCDRGRGTARYAGTAAGAEAEGVPTAIRHSEE